MKRFGIAAASFLVLSCTSSGALARVLFNEIMYNTGSRDEEWIELYNAGQHEMDLDGWAVADRHRRITLSGPYARIPAGAFLLLAHRAFEDHASLQIALPSLNNGGDDLVLYDERGAIADRLCYRSEWGGARSVSLERLDALPPANRAVRSNWTSCIHPDGHTAGRINSVTAGVAAGVSIGIVPDPFDLRRSERALIEYSLPLRLCAVVLDLYDLSGKLIIRLLDGEPAGAAGRVCWDGRDRFGGVCATGIYMIKLRAIDAASGRVAAATR